MGELAYFETVFSCSFQTEKSVLFATHPDDTFFVFHETINILGKRHRIRTDSSFRSQIPLQATVRPIYPDRAFFGRCPEILFLIYKKSTGLKAGVNGLQVAGVREERYLGNIPGIAEP